MSEINIDSTYGTLVLQEFKLVYVDDNYAWMLGYDSAKDLMLNVESVLDLIDSRHHQIAKDRFVNVSRGIYSPRCVTFDNVDRFGRRFTVLLFEQLVEWEGGKAVKLAIVDLTAVESAYQQLFDTKQKYKNLITTSAQGIAIFKGFVPVMVNNAWVKLTHAPSIEYVLKHLKLMDLISKEEHQEVFERYNKIMEGEVTRSNRVMELVCFDNKSRYFNVYYNRVEWDGEVAVQAVIEDVTEKIKLQEKLKRNSETDALTQVCNRLKLDLVLADEHSRFKRYSHAFSVILIDLDHFKSINDSLGHLAGDQVLISVAGLIRSSTRQVDIVGRWGGEEFMVVCPNTDLLGASALAEHLRVIIENAEVNVDWSVTASFGVAMSLEGDSCDQLLARADEALYAAKRKGRNQVVSHSRK